MKKYHFGILSIVLAVFFVSCDMGTEPNEDSENPTITITQPADGDTVSGLVQVKVDAQDNQSVDSVKFYVDGVLQESAVSSPWNFSWDASAFADSNNHVIRAEAVDPAGNMASDQISVLVFGESGIQPTVFFDADIQPIFNNNCAFSGCHGTNNPQQGLVLAEGEAYDNIVNVQSTEESTYDLIEPNKPDSSFLFLKIQPDPPSGQRMPRGGPYLSGDQIDMIETWITEGAQNN